MVTYRPKWYGRAWIYGATIGLMIFVGLIEHYLRHSSPELIFLKVMFMPMFVLAWYGAEFLCNSDQAYKRWTAQYFERHALNTLVFSIFYIFVLSPHTTFNQLVTGFVTVFAVYFSLSIVFPRRRTKSE